MKCRDMMDKITAARDALNSEERAHLDSCPTCSRMRGQWRALQSAAPKARKVPLSADFLVNSEARVFAEKRAAHAKSAHRWVSFASAAACVLFFGMAYVSFLRNPSAGEGAAGTASVASRQAAMSPAQDSEWGRLGMESDCAALRDEIDAAIRTLGATRDQEIPESQKYFATKINDMI